MGFKTTTLLVLAALSAANAFYKLIPEGKELVYDYKALVTAGTDFPETFASEFKLHGKLHVQCVGHVAFMKFTDLMYKMYNGKMDHEYEAHEVPISPELEDMYKVFSVSYDEMGKATGYSTFPGEKQFSQNIKKAVAATFQMDYTKVMSTTKKHAFISLEHSLYGEDDTHYNVLTHKDGTVTVEKLHEMNSTSHLYHHFLKNVEFHEMEAPFEDPLTHDSQKEYTLTKHDGHYVAKHIVSTGGIYIHPFRAKSETQQIHTKITYELITVTPVTTKFEMKTPELHKDFTLFVYDTSVDSPTTPNLYQGRRNQDMKKMELQVDTMLKETVAYIAQNHLAMKQPDIKQGQLINRIMRIITQLDKTTLDHLWTKWSEKTDEEGKKVFEVFQQILPLVGTRSTLMLILDLVSHNKVKDTQALHMLHEMPMNVKVPTTKLLVDMEPMLHMDTTKVSWEIRKAAILSFSTLIHKTHLYLQKGSHSHHEEIEHFADKYVTEFVTKLKEADTFETKMVYLEAMHNTDLHSFVPHLEKIIKGEWTVDEHLRFMTMWCVSSMVEHDEDKLFELYWPIMTDTSELTHFRILAYYLMMEARPSLSRMINMYWHMQHETNHEVYQFYYKYLYALAHTNDASKVESKLHATQVLKYTHPPNFYGLTGFYEMDYSDEKYGFGKGMETLFVLDKKTAFIILNIEQRMFNMKMFPHTYLIKVHGIEGIEKLGLNTKDATTLFTYDEFLQFFSNIKKVKEVHIEVVLMEHSKIVHSYFFDGDTIETLPYIFLGLSEDFTYKKSFVDIYSKMYAKIFIPTEIGFTASLDWILPTVEVSSYDIKRETVKDTITYHVDIQSKTWMHGRYGLSFYNSITDVWQGVNRYKSYDSSYPLFMDVTINTATPESLRLSFKKHKDVTKDTFGYRSHLTTMTFVKDDYHTGVLTKSAPKAEHFVIVTKGDEHRYNYEVTHEIDYFQGYERTVSIFDSELRLTNTTLKNIGHIFELLDDEYFESDDTTNFLMTYLHKWDLITMQPFHGTHGVIEKFVPSKEHPVTHFDITFRSHYDMTKGDYFLLPGIKLNTKLALTTVRDEKTMKTWDIHTIFDVNPGHTTMNLKMQLHRIIPDQTPFKMCIEGTKKWMPDSVTGHMTVAELTGPIEKKCTPEDNILEITMMGEKSSEQKAMLGMYTECEETVATPDGHHHKILPCYMAHNTFRKYTYDIKSSMNTLYKKFFVQMWDAFKSLFYDHYTFVHDPSKVVEADHTKVIITYPQQGDTFNTYVITPNHEYHFEDLTDKPFQWLMFHPDSAQFSMMYKFMHKMGWTDYCGVYNDTIHYKYTAMPYHLPNEWTLMVGEKADNPLYAVYVKEIEGTNHMALKMVHNTHTVIFTPTTEHHFDTMIDGTVLTPKSYQHTGEWFFFQQMPHTNYMTIITKHLGIHMYYDSTHVHIEVPKTDVTYYGKCLPH